MRALYLVLLLSAPCFGADQWIRLTTRHFELYTEAGEGKGREAILYFEQVRSFFLLASPAKHVPDFPVRLIAFKGEKQYKPYRINEAAFAYYTGGHDRDYIVMQDAQSEHYPVAVHEYTHLIIRHTGLKLPVWMNEGWAELYSSMKPLGKKVVVGALIPGRLQALSTSGWLPLSVLTAVGQGSPLYNEREKAGVFYAESWALMHMLFLNKRYQPNFAKFVAAIQSKPAEAAFEQAKAAYERLAKENPQRPEIEESLGYLSWQDGDRNAAREHFGKALALGTKNPQMCYHYAMLEHERNGLAVEADALRKAVQLKSDYLEARMQLGSVLLNQQNYAGALAAWYPIKKVNEQQAEWYFNALAFASLKVGDTEGARRNAEAAKKWSKTPDQTAQAQSILTYLDQMNQPRQAAPPKLAIAAQPEFTVTEESVEPALERVEGKAQTLDCNGKSARLSVLTQQGALTFDIPDPSSVAIKHSSEVTHDFACGKQDGYPIVVRYLPQAAASGSLGIVKALEF